MRDWTNKNGDTIRAKALYEAGKSHVKPMVESRWIQYPLEDLSEEDREALSVFILAALRRQARHLKRFQEGL